MSSSPPRIVELVETFDRNIETYHSQQYNETQLRREFIDPFFEELGWDVSNKQGYAQAYKEVIHEDAVKVGTATKAPDYSFRIGGVRKFFLEAKKPSINIGGDPHPAYQLRRYAWSAKLPVSILTDFEEFAVYDCQMRPKQTDGTSTARIMFLTYKDYIDQWSKIADIFSKDAVLKGSFDKFAVSAKAKRGTTTVDKEFLAEIENWRQILAKVIALRNRTLSIHELNFAVQRTIDRILFLRMCEDRGIENYGQLLKISAGDRTYLRLCEIFEKADQIYNSGLFHFTDETDRAEPPDKLTLNLIIDDKDLKWILHNLYYPQSPYEFSVLPAEILGNVYEQFLGKVILVSPARHVKIEPKPEVKKAGGIYYTPDYIVDYIVKNTVGRLLGVLPCHSRESGNPQPRHSDSSEESQLYNSKSKIVNRKSLTPKQVANLRILDPACGSGSFLLGAYTYLLNYIRDWYIKNDPEKWAKKKNPPIYQVPFSRRRHLSTIALAKVDGDESHCERSEAIPNYRLTVSEKKRILLNNIFGVDIDSQAVEVTKLSLLLKVLEGENSQTLENQYLMFHERALPDLGNNIKCGNSLIGPDFFENPDIDSSDEELQQKINTFNWHSEFPQVFSGKTPGFDAVIGNPPYGADLSKKERGYLEKYFKLGTTDTAALFMAQQDFLLKNKGIGGFIIPKPFTYASNWEKVRDRFLDGIMQIVDVSKVWKEVKLEQTIYFFQKGVKTTEYISSVRSKELIYEVGKIQKSLCHQFGFLVNGVTEIEIQIADKLQKQKCFLKDLVINQRGGMLQEYVISRKSDFQVLGGKHINRYIVADQIKGFISKEHICDEKAFIKPKSILAQNIIAHIQSPIDHIKIIATLPEKTYPLILDTINQLENISNLSSYYLLGILNSKLINWYVYRFIFAKAIRTMHFDPPATDRIPYPQLNLKRTADKARHDRLVNLVQRMLDLHKKLTAAKVPDEKTKLQRQITTTDSAIDNLVYDLYNLTPQEIKIVEGSN
jgi:type I restriction-modification system DNA methylase subunit